MKKLILSALVLGALTALAGAQPRHVDVVGQAEVYRTPDQALVTLGVEAWAPKLEDARKDAEGRMAQVLAVPGKFGVAAEDVRTDFARIEPRYEQDERGNVTFISGYRVSQGLVIRVKDLTKVGPLVGAALAAGANRLDGVAFGLAHPEAAAAEARVAAVRDAKAQAQALAAELGQKVGQPLSVNEAPQYRGPAPMLLKAAAFDSAQAGDPTFAPGQISVSTQVSVSFELLGK